MKKLILVMVWTLFFASVSGEGWAAIVCKGNITSVALGPTGIVQVDYGHGVHYLCSLTSLYGSFTPEACQGLYSMLLTAQATRRAVAFNYSNYAACGDIGSWVMPNPQPYFINLAEAQ